MPSEIVDVSLAERFGWTWAELDEQDMSQVLPAVSASNIHAALRRVENWMHIAAYPGYQNSPMPSADDMAILTRVKQAQKERDA